MKPSPRPVMLNQESVSLEVPQSVSSPLCTKGQRTGTREGDSGMETWVKAATAYLIAKETYPKRA